MRIQKYQYWGFYGGLIITVGSIILGSSTNQLIWNSVLDATYTIGVLMLFASIGSILPLSIWGFVRVTVKAGGSNYFASIARTPFSALIFIISIFCIS